MKISVFGIGYVGAVAAACLARDGHEVVAVDVNRSKVDQINEGRSPIGEFGLGELIARCVSAGRLSAIRDPIEAVARTELSFVCVGTPSRANGSLDLQFVTAVCRQIGEAIQAKDTSHTVIVRSTMLPGTVRGLVIPELEIASGKKAGVDFLVGYNPEFLREGTAIHDYDTPPKTVVGGEHDAVIRLMFDIYGHLPAPFISASYEEAEMVKYIDNTWHALKVAFANEMGAICESADVDRQKVMDIFCQDKKLNISPKYLKPGFSFGGSCLPKDVRAISFFGRNLDVSLPIVNNIIDSNDRHLDRAFEKIKLVAPDKTVGVFGLSFKAMTDDLRESPAVRLCERLIGSGYAVKIYDRNISLSRIFGQNKSYVDQHLPHISALMEDTPDHVFEFASTVIVTYRDDDIDDIMNRCPEGKLVVDLSV